MFSPEYIEVCGNCEQREDQHCPDCRTCEYYDIDPKTGKGDCGNSDCDEEEIDWLDEAINERRERGY